MIESLPLWLTWIQTTALVAIPVVGLWIAHRQMRLAGMKVKHDLFERRVAVFDATTKFIAHILSTGKVDEGQWVSYMRATANAEFLFNDRLADYLAGLRERAAKQLSNEYNVNTPSETQQDAINEKYEGLKYFARQLEEARSQFRPFLSFERPSLSKRMSRLVSPMHSMRLTPRPARKIKLKSAGTAGTPITEQ
jgi:hypothetical protein